MMKTIKILLPIVAGLCLMASPAVAQVTGTVGLNYGQTEYNYDDGDNVDAEHYGLQGGVAIEMSGPLVILGDASWSHDEYDFETTATSGHVIHRTDGQAFGGFLGLMVDDLDYGDATTYFGGAEYAKFFPKSTMTVAGGYGYTELDDGYGFDEELNTWAVEGQYRHFVTDNLRIDAGLGLHTTSYDGDYGDASFGAGVGVEWRMPSTPVSIGASYRYSEGYYVEASNAVDVDWSEDTETFLITLRYDFGNGSLKERDRKGNTFGQFGGVGGALSFF